jgi:hypothetical protein
MIETKRPGTRIVAVGRNRGFVEHPIAGRPGYISRTYYLGGRPYARVYREYAWRGVVYGRYVPEYYYDSVFYSWATGRWGGVAYGWGWNAAPWYVNYGGYFTPAPAYGAPSLWLTDYLIAENLKVAYDLQQQEQQRQASTPPPPPGQGVQTDPMLSDQVKTMIAEEVKQQLAAERAVSLQSPTAPTANPTEALPPALDPTLRVFVVSSAIDVPAAGGKTCGLTPGDIVLRTADTMDADNMVAVNVLSSKPGECAMHSATSLALATLQEMHNQFREHIDSGLKVLADNEGKGSIPKGPPSVARPAAEGQAQPDMGVAAMIADQQKDADQAEAEARRNSAGVAKNN